LQYIRKGKCGKHRVGRKEDKEEMLVKRGKEWKEL
jgi:hypothetical protein